MATKAYKKSILREIVSSKARFFSIIVIILLGVSFYSGIKSAGPDMDQAINDFYSQQNLMDSKIVSTLGLTDKDLELLQNNEKILDFYGTRTIDANLTNSNNLVRFMEYDKQNTINDLVVLEGRLPENPGEIALDERAFKVNGALKLGDEYIIESDEKTMENFKESRFQIVGMVRSPLYIEKESRGITSVGKGTIDYFAVLNSRDINMDVYTEIYVRFKNVEGLEAYSEEYSDLMEVNNAYLEELFEARAAVRVKEVKADVQKELEEGYKELEVNEQKLLDAEKELQNGRKELEEGKQQYDEALVAFEQGIKDGEAQLAAGTKDIENGQKEINKQKLTIQEGQKQLDQAKVELDQAKETFINEGINPDASTAELEHNINSLEMLISQGGRLASEIRNAAASANEGIPLERIQVWKVTLANLGLGDLVGAVEELEKDSTNTQVAQGIAQSLDEVVENSQSQVGELTTLLNGITTYQQGKGQYEAQLANFNKGKLQLEEAQKQLEMAESELANGKKELNQSKVQGKNELDQAKQQLAEAEIELMDGEKEIQENKQKLAEARLEITEEEKDIFGQLEKSSYYVFDRTDNQGYLGYKDAIECLDNIATVLPLFFFLVAILICLTTMTRMVEENRIEIGTLKALGYNDLEIAWKYIIYAAIASISGSILGILIGSSVLPSVIASAYGSLYSLPKLTIYYYPSYIVQSMLLSILCTVGAALFVIRVELKSKPSGLMQAKAPKIGKKILLERITPLWSRLSFNHKVTLRNIFRYKQRMIMTILGIAGCMALLVTGFGLKDSTTVIVDKQFEKLWQYEAMVIQDENADEQEIKQYNDTVKQMPGYEDSINMHQQAVTFNEEDMNKQTATLYVPQNLDVLDEFVLLNDRLSGEKYEINDDGVIINEKLAKLLGVSAGDTITLKDEHNKSYTVKVDKIAENYVMHYLYMSPDYYEAIFSQQPVYNTQFVNFSEDRQSDDEISSKLLACKNVVNVTLKSQMQKSTEESNDSMKLVMVVIIIAAGCLAFVVLYNLNNINVSERIRELSTIKVLGFFHNEVTMYILRENVILTLMGIIAGSCLGKVLHAYIIHTAETDTMMMYPDISISSYIFSALLTVFFSLVVMILMHIKIKNVNMIDALKSNE